MRAEQTKPLNTRLLLEIRSAESRHGCVSLPSSRRIRAPRASRSSFRQRKTPSLTKLPKRLALFTGAEETKGCYQRKIRLSPCSFFLLFLFPSSVRNRQLSRTFATRRGVWNSRGRRVADGNFLARVPPSPRFGRERRKSTANDDLRNAFRDDVRSVKSKPRRFNGLEERRCKYLVRGGTTRDTR